MSVTITSDNLLAGCAFFIALGIYCAAWWLLACEGTLQFKTNSAVVVLVVAFVAQCAIVARLAGLP